MRRLTAASLAVLALAGCATASDPADLAYLSAYRAAEAAAKPFAPITDTRPAATLDDAYRLQKGLVAQRRAHGDRVAGYRGGLMSQASMKGRGVTAPLAGVLFTSGRASDGATISLCPYRKATLELKLGFVFREAVRTPPADLAALRRAVGQVAPVVDLPDIGYRDPDHYGAVDMVAANISAARWVTGPARAPDGLDLDVLTVSLVRDGQTVAQGQGKDSFDSQWAGLDAVVRQILASGRTIAPGDIVLTGRMGERPWLTPGAYRADYGALGAVAFRVEACR